MAIPANVQIWAEPLDPYDVMDYTIDVSSLLEGFGVASYTVQPTAEAALLGLQVGTSAYATTISGNVIRVWFNVALANQNDFQTETQLPVEVSLTTTSSPARKKQRTVVLKVVQR